VVNPGLRESAESRSRVLSGAERRADLMVEGCFLIFCSHVSMSPVSGASEGLPVGDSYLGRYYGILVASMVLRRKMRIEVQLTSS